MVFFLVMFVLEGIGTMLAAVPFIRRRVKPNPWSGFRVAATLNDEETWYRVNERFGRWLFAAGAVFTAAAIALWFVPGIGGTIVAYNIACLGVICVMLLVAGFASIKAI